MEAFTFKTIHETYTDMVFSLCLNYLKNSTDAEDVHQNVFVRIHQNIKNFEEKSSLKTWIYRITINQCNDYKRSKKSKKRCANVVSIFQEDQKDACIPIPCHKHPAAILEDKEKVELILNKIDELTGNQKTAILLKAVDGLNQKEIAEVMGISVKAVESLLSRGRNNLKKKLQYDGYC